MKESIQADQRATCFLSSKVGGILLSVNLVKYNMNCVYKDVNSDRMSERSVYIDRMNITMQQSTILWHHLFRKFSQLFYYMLKCIDFLFSKRLHTVSGTV